jgi:hypothetical protein
MATRPENLVGDANVFIERDLRRTHELNSSGQEAESTNLYLKTLTKVVFLGDYYPRWRSALVTSSVQYMLIGPA